MVVLLWNPLIDIDPPSMATFLLKIQFYSIILWKSIKFKAPPLETLMEKKKNWRYKENYIKKYIYLRNIVGKFRILYWYISN